MDSLEVFYINQVLLALKNGKSVQAAEDSFIKEFPVRAKRLAEFQNSKNSSVLYELELILKRGREGYPVIKSLSELRKRASEKFLTELERFIQKAPFLSLVPLFLFYFPALLLVFVGPFFLNLLEELN